MIKNLKSQEWWRFILNDAELLRVSLYNERWEC